MYIGGIVECFEIEQFEDVLTENDDSTDDDEDEGDEDLLTFPIQDEEYMFGYTVGSTAADVTTYPIKINARVKRPNKLLNRLFKLAGTEYNLMQNNTYTVITFRHIDHQTILLRELEEYQNSRNSTLTYETCLVSSVNTKSFFLMGLKSRYEPECVIEALKREYGFFVTNCEKSDNLVNFIVELDETHTVETLERNVIGLLGDYVKWMEVIDEDESELDMTIPGTKTLILRGLPTEFEPICVKYGLDTYRNISVYDCERKTADDFLVTVDDRVTATSLNSTADTVSGHKVRWLEPQNAAQAPVEEKTTKAFVLRGLSEIETSFFFGVHNLECVKFERLRNYNSTSSNLMLVVLDGDYTEEILNSMYPTFLARNLVWSAYMNKKRIVQCINCQAWGHGYYECTNEERCMKCAQDHRTELCSKSRLCPATCVNCLGDHPANASICPIYLGLIRELDGVKGPPIPQDYGLTEIPRTPQALAA